MALSSYKFTETELLPDIASLSGDDLIRQYKKEAKAADRRLRNIEEASKRPEYQNIKTFAYAKAMKDITFRFGDPEKGAHPRWDKRVAGKYSEADIRKTLAGIRDFMRKPSSSPRALKKVYQQRVTTLNKKYGTNFTWQEFADFAVDERFKALMGGYGSDTFFTKVSEERKKAQKVVKDMSKSRKRVQRYEEDNKINEMVFQALGEESGISIEDLPASWR